MNAFLRRFFQIIIFIALSFLYFYFMHFIILFLFPDTPLSFNNIIGLICILVYIVVTIPLILIAVNKIHIK